MYIQTSNIYSCNADHDTLRIKGNNYSNDFSSDTVPKSSLLVSTNGKKKFNLKSNSDSKLINLVPSAFVTPFYETPLTFKHCASDDYSISDFETKSVNTNLTLDETETKSKMTNTSSDAYYKAKLRSGFIDLRNSYNEKIKSRPARSIRSPLETITQKQSVTQFNGGNEFPNSSQFSLDDMEPPSNVNQTNSNLYPKKYSHNQKYYSHSHNTLLKNQDSNKIKDISQNKSSQNIISTGPSHRIYRSNSNLELEHPSIHQFDTRCSRTDRPLTSYTQRDYGSTSSLDVIGSSVSERNDFFQALEKYREVDKTSGSDLRGSCDQRLPAPDYIRELVSPPYSVESQNIPVSISNVDYQTEKLNYLKGEAVSPEQSADMTDSAPSATQSPTLKEKSAPNTKLRSQKSRNRKSRAKSVASDTISGGIFKKLRSTKMDSTENSQAASLDNDLSVQSDHFRALNYFDTQSVRVKFPLPSHSARLNCQNTQTGASAAASASYESNKSNKVRAENELGGSNVDIGDGKSNELVLSCPHFRNEFGDEERRSITLNPVSAKRRVQQLLGSHMDCEVSSLAPEPLCNSICVLDDSSSCPSESSSVHGNRGPSAMRQCAGYLIEHIDLGATYYNNYFVGQEHQNFVGVDETLGPVAVSLLRERAELTHKAATTSSTISDTSNTGFYQYRLICRTRQLAALRCSILEDVIPFSSRLSGSRGLPAKDVLEFAVPELQLSSLRVASSSSKLGELLIKLDEQGIIDTYKFGVLLCCSGQSTEEEMYNNEDSTPLFNEFIHGLGEKVQLNGFTKYRGGLDVKTDSTGTHSIYRHFHDYEIMFHVATMLPYTPNNKQQLLKKRHIGNDIVTIVFQEPGAPPFTPQSVRSKFQHVFILVRAYITPNGIQYKLSVTRSKEVPSFGPPIPESGTFTHSQNFFDFLLTKAINAENAVHKSEKFVVMAERTREQYLKDLCEKYSTSTSLDSGSRLGKFSLGSGRKKERNRLKRLPDVYSFGAISWRIQIEDFGHSMQLECIFVAGYQHHLIMEVSTRDVLFVSHNLSIIGWTNNKNSLRIYYDNGECLVLKDASTSTDSFNLSSPPSPLSDDYSSLTITEIVDRLAFVSNGHETIEMTLLRNGFGQLGFHVQFDGLITEVEPHGHAWKAGLRPGSRLVEICKVARATLTHDQMIDLLRTSETVRVVVIPALKCNAETSQSQLPSNIKEADVCGRHSTDKNLTLISSHGPDIINDKTSTTLSSVNTELEHFAPKPAVPSLRSTSHHADSRALQISGVPALTAGSTSYKPWSSQITSLSGLSMSKSIDSGAHYDNKFELSDKKVKVSHSPVTYHHFNTISSQNKFSVPQLSKSLNSSCETTDTTQHHGYVKTSLNWKPASSNLSDSCALSLNNTTESSYHYALTNNLTSHQFSKPRLSLSNALSTASVRTASPSVRTASQAVRTASPKDVTRKHESNQSLKRDPLIHSSSSPLSYLTNESELTPPARPPPPVTPPSTNFQQDLLRLINPDPSSPPPETASSSPTNRIYLSKESKQSLNSSGSSLTLLHKNNHNSSFSNSRGLQRTVSDESICGFSNVRYNFPQVRQPNPHLYGNSLPSETSLYYRYDNFRKSTDNLSSSISTFPPPRRTLRTTALSTVGQTNETHTRARRANSGPLLNHPVTASNLEWNSLVKAASSIVPSNEDIYSESTSGNPSTSPYLTTNSLLPHQNYRSSDETLSNVSHDLNLRHQNQLRQPIPNDYEQLQARIDQLQLELHKEQADHRKAQKEIEKLRSDNVRLEEESQTAAAQLRKFAGLFFNSIDGQ